MTAEIPRRIVFDPNVLVSAAITPAGALGRLTRLIDAGLLAPIASAHLLDELASVLARKKFRRYLTLDAAEAYVAELGRLAEWHEDPPAPARVCPDPDDDYLVALARSAATDALVSGDADLHAVPDPGIRILTPRELLRLLAEDE